MPSDKRRAALKRAPTMEDVARAAGVNRVTVSMALRGNHEGTRNGTRISETTRQRILGVAQELGYSRSAIAMAFRRQRTDLIGFYAGAPFFVNLHLPFFAEVINALTRRCSTHEQDLLLYSDFARQSTNEIYTALSSGKIDGLVVLPTQTNPVIERLADSHLPAVAIANPVPKLPSVRIDEAQGSRLIVEHLARTGHRRVLYRLASVEQASPEMRHRAFIRAAADAGIEVITSPQALANEYLTEAERALLQAPAHQRPTAVVGWSDSSAYVVLEECIRLGLRVPDDVAIIGFDGIPPSVPPVRRLTSVRAPWAKVAETALDYVVTLIDGGQVPMETMLSVGFELGETA